jgi:hypothetical protein
VYQVSFGDIRQGTRQIEAEALEALPLELGIVETQNGLARCRRHGGMVTQATGLDAAYAKSSAVVI